MITNALTSVLIALNIAPQAAHHVTAYSGTANKVGVVELGGLGADYSAEKLYSFGLLADTHVSAFSPNSSTNHLGNALRHLTNKEKVEFTVLAGDVVSDYTTFALDLLMYSNVVASVKGCAQVYPTTGSKDCPATQSGLTDIATFKAVTGTAAKYGADATYSYELTVSHTPTGTVNAAAVTDHFLFLGMKNAQTQASLVSPYLDADIDWLGTKLKDYENDRCFVVTHLPFPEGAGNPNGAFPTTRSLGGNQLTALQSLRAQYPRAVWFSGLSHFKWQYQELDLEANVHPTSAVGRDVAWTVHVPSCGQPAETTGSYGNMSLIDLESQGGVVDVYADHIDIRGIQFKGRREVDYRSRYVSVAQYRLPITPASN